MSIYGGFGTRAQELMYGRLTEELIGALQMKTICIFNGETMDDVEWSRYIMGILNKMKKMENRKYIPPKYSQQCQDLIKTVQQKFPDVDFKRVRSKSPSFIHQEKVQQSILQQSEIEENIEYESPTLSRINPLQHRKGRMIKKGLAINRSNTQKYYTPSKDSSPILARDFQGRSFINRTPVRPASLTPALVLEGTKNKEYAPSEKFNYMVKY